MLNDFMLRVIRLSVMAPYLDLCKVGWYITLQEIQTVKLTRMMVWSKTDFSRRKSFKILRRNLNKEMVKLFFH
jgi:hypothetical protein